MSIKSNGKDYNKILKGYTALYDFVRKCEVLPICEAECERVFSSMGLVITKRRKSMKLELLDALITI